MNIINAGYEILTPIPAINQRKTSLEHSSLSVKFICDRGVSHELVSFAQEGTRYCNYGKTEEGITFIKPLFFADTSEEYGWWASAMQQAEISYMELIKKGCPPQQARSVLPNSVKTEVIMTANYREWRNFLNLRAARATGPAHPQMEELTVPLLDELSGLIPVVFDDILYKCAEWRALDFPRLLRNL